MKYSVLILLVLAAVRSPAVGDAVFTDRGIQHVRNGAADSSPEWTGFPVVPESSVYERTFSAKATQKEFTLRLVQQDVKQIWTVTLNDSNIGQLHRDENAIETVLPIPAGVIRDGENHLVITTKSKTPDDIRIGSVEILPTDPASLLNEAGLKISVTDADTKAAVPCRITVLHENRLMTTAAESTDESAVRPGVIYCRGAAEFGLPAGT